MLRTLFKAAAYGCFLAMVWAAAGSYHVPLNLPDAELKGLTLAVSAGATLPAGTKIDEGSLQQLRKAAPAQPDPKSIRVLEFAWRRWQSRWVFVASSCFLLAFSLATPLAGAALETKNGLGTSKTALELKHILDDFQVELASLAKIASNASLDFGKSKLQTPENAALGSRYIEKLEILAGRCHDAIQRLKEPLQRDLGLRAAVPFLSDYASLERAINRAWSAATDGYSSESVSSIALALNAAAACLKRLA